MQPAFRITVRIWVCLGLSCLAFPKATVAADTNPAGIEFFEKHIRPTFAEHCWSCHSEAANREKKLKGGLLLDTEAGILAGGDSGPMVVPGNKGGSLLLRALHHEDLKMPPSSKLPDATIVAFEQWVDMGAPLPAGGKASLASKDIDWDKARQAWAFQLPIEHAAPPIQDNHWSISKIDHFVLAELEKRGLKPVGPASKRDLIRRATFDLIGLPPTPEEVDSFLRDETPEAFATVVDRLLQSSHYGERWARYWLDLARYADDQGNSFLSPTPTAYLYRDWLVRALNHDMPFDEFIRLQIAGDEVPGTAEDYVERLAGLGFQGLGPQFRKGAAGEAKAKADELEDRVDTLSRALLGLTVSCARCHDHKFDPIPTRDYYSLAAAYNGASWPERMLASPETVQRFREWEQAVQKQKADLEQWTAEQGRQLGRTALEKVDLYLSAAATIRTAKRLQQPFDELALAQQQQLVPALLSKLTKYVETINESDPLFAWRNIVDKEANSETTTEDLKQQTATLKQTVASALTKLDAAANPNKDSTAPPEALSPEETQILKSLWQQDSSPFFISGKDASALFDAAKTTEQADRQKALNDLVHSPPPTGPSMPSVSGGGDALQVFVRGNPLNLGEPAPPGFLRILNAPNKPVDPSSSTKPHFTRLELANSIANRQNPLTARVLVNRVWHYHFGRGIVSSLGNFGKNGVPPTHPDLLDTLAVRFMNHGWSIKALHREIMLSATYQLSSEHHPENEAIDPDNHFLWRMSPRRLDFEAWRDAMLSVSGRLDPTLGGPALDLKTPAVKEVPGLDVFTRLVGLELDDPAHGRRTLYCIVSRYAPHPTATLFDFPEPNVASDVRNVTTIPQQQLFVLNSPFTIAMGRAFAARILTSAPQDDERLKKAWEIAYGRPPTEAEISLSLAFLNDNTNGADADKLARWEQLCHSLLVSNEFLFVR